MKELRRWALALAVIVVGIAIGAAWQVTRPPVAEASGAGNDMYLMATAESRDGEPYCYLFYRQYDQVFIFRGAKPVALYTLKEIGLQRSGLPMDR